MKKNFYTHYVSTHYAHIAPDQSLSFQKRYYVWKSDLAPMLPSDKKSAILEIGAGVGHNLYALRKLGYKHIIGTDYSKECVTSCKKLGFTCYEVNEKTEKAFYSSHKTVFDAVILYDVLEHCSPDVGESLLRSIRSMLKKDGRVLISLPNASHPFSNTLFFADITHKFIYNDLSLSQLLRNSGFSRIQFAQMNSFVSYDEVFIKYLIKLFVLRPIAYMGELFWRLLALSQGIVLRECKPTLIAVASK